MSTIDSLAPSGVQPEVKPAVQEAGAWGNSAPLGLAAFAVTTFMLSMINAELMKGPDHAGGVRRGPDVRGPDPADRRGHPVPHRERVHRRAVQHVRRVLAVAVRDCRVVPPGRRRA